MKQFGEQFLNLNWCTFLWESNWSRLRPCYFRILSLSTRGQRHTSNLQTESFVGWLDLRFNLLQMCPSVRQQRLGYKILTFFNLFYRFNSSCGYYRQMPHHPQRHIALSGQQDTLHQLHWRVVDHSWRRLALAVALPLAPAPGVEEVSYARLRGGHVER